ncbi:S-adenosylmethionine:tRNA ribosyltransferase-isomerase [Arundinibacter roseus]|uniref:S-adenosylmethionine:tRNA ribosyltransferase-isomerase n=1 Tax=Arundinibacter roseus TaxID=2070510 RepID=A0A4R4KQA3_9BACT|nr:S-adenosylmethionine:tRNA ribosyltransferase-isomerase [Arundinibacter roseus]TDB68769.1 S-adenosylmethionine:tRNA ribosyltransferase-isomerase [Arundinibacter roseus]
MQENWQSQADALLLSEFTYDLPDERIARYPVSPRHDSRLLIYEQSNIEHTHFHQLTNYLPAQSLLVFNDTRVIPARVYFQKSTGATIEVLLLNPEAPTTNINEAMLAKQASVWTCMIGNKKRWKLADTLSKILTINNQSVLLRAAYANYEQNQVELSWDTDATFLEIVQALGEIPLPPYLNRNTEERDLDTYQTVYARQEGAVAAPTAGLHFTETVLNQLEAKGIKRSFLTLHVGAGTFQPIKVENVINHSMHSEQIVFTRAFIEQLLVQNGPIVAVGTTSMRSLESLYWFGVKLYRKESTTFWIEKLYPYSISESDAPSLTQSLEAILEQMMLENKDEVTGQTEIFIFPGYSFKVCDGLITNYHQPGSTLILLVAAFVGQNWKQIYEAAYLHGYRFLSYGDSSLLWRNQRSV